MKIALGLLALTLLGCQSTSNAPVTSAPEPVRVVTSAPPEVVPPTPRRPLARLNPRRQRLEVGEAPPQVRPRPLKVGVQVVNPRPQAQPVYQPPVYQPQVHVQVVVPQAPTPSWPPPTPPQRATMAGGQAQVDAFMSQERERIRQNNEMLMNRVRPGGGLPPEMQQIAYPQAAQPQIGPSLAHQQAERRYLEARADFLNTKYVPNGPLRYTADNVRGGVGTGMPLPPDMMNRPAMFNPVLQKAQQAEVLRQQMVRTP